MLTKAYKKKFFNKIQKMNEWVRIKIIKNFEQGI